jgi:hypothetical protein
MFETGCPMKPSVYLASSFSRQAEMRVVAERLRAIGVECTSRWLNEDQSIHTKGSRPKFLERCALTDIEDVRRADVFVRFSDAEEMSFPLVASHLATGARHFEMGLAWALRHQILVVGGRQHVFDWLQDGILHLPDTDALIEHFSGRIN